MMKSSRWTVEISESLFGSKVLSGKGCGIKSKKELAFSIFRDWG